MEKSGKQKVLFVKDKAVCTCNVLGPVHHSEHASLLDHAGTYDLVLVCSHPEGHLGS